MKNIYISSTFLCLCPHWLAIKLNFNISKKAYYHHKNLALRLALKRRQTGIRKWPVTRELWNFGRLWIALGPRKLKHLRTQLLSVKLRGTVVLNLLFLGQNWIKILISTSAHTIANIILDNPLTWNVKYIYGTKSYSHEFLATFWKHRLQTWKVWIHFRPLNPWLSTTKNSFSALQLLLVTKLQHHFLVFIDAKTCFSVLKFD